MLPRERAYNRLSTPSSSTQAATTGECFKVLDCEADLMTDLFHCFLLAGELLYSVQINKNLLKFQQ